MRADAQPELLREIGRWSLVALVINCIIGSGIFGLPATVAGQLGAWAPLGFIAAAAGMGTIMGCFAEVSSRFTQAGGPYLYARAAFGRFIGIETAWLAWMARLTASAANANLFVDYLAEFLPPVTSGAPRIAVSTAIIGALTIVNVRGVRSGARTSNFFTLAKLLPLGVLIVAGGAFLATHGWQGRADSGRPLQIMDAMLLLVFTYGGFESAVIPLGEARDPRRDTPFALGAALVCCTVVYTAVQIVAMGVLPDLAGTARPLAAAARAILGSGGAVLLTLGALFATYGLLSANMLNVPRLTYALAREGEFPAFFGLAHPRYRTPHVSIAIFALMLWGLTLYGSFRWNAELSVVARLFTYAVVCAALPVLRQKRPGEARFLLPGGNVLAVAGVAYCGLVGSRVGWNELIFLLIMVVVAAGNWWLSRPQELKAT